MAPRDPYRNFRFEVEINGFTHAGFQKVSGLKHSVQVIDYREGGENEVMRKLPGQSTFDPITLERGMSNNNDFVDWIEQIFNLDNIDGQPPLEGWRRKVVIYAKNKAGTRVKKWTVFNAWPSENMPGDLDASGNDVLIETLVLQNEGIKQQNLAAA
jgi:phage tail-like protein